MLPNPTFCKMGEVVTAAIPSTMQFGAFFVEIPGSTRNDASRLTRNGFVFVFIVEFYQVCRYISLLKFS